MREIQTDSITEAVKDMCIAINYTLSEDMTAALQDAMQKEVSPLGRQVLGQLQENLLIAEQERIQDVRNQIAYKHGVYDGNVNEVKKDILRDRNEEYKKQAEHEARAEYMNAGFQTAQNIQKGADVAIAVGEKIAS